MDDEYAEDDFEASLDDATAAVGTVSGIGAYTAAAASGGGEAPEDELRPPASPASADEEEKEVTPRQRSRALQDALAVDDDALLASDDDEGSHRSDGEGSHSGGGPGTRSRLKRKNPSASKTRVSGRHLLDNSLWVFSICATRIRSLQVPVATRPATAAAYGREALPPAIRELRVFATLDKQSMQSQGSAWKCEPRPETPRLQKNLRDRAKRTGAGGASGATGRVSPGKRASAPPSSSSSSLLGRRSGFLDEASWRKDHGTLRWAFSMEKFRKLKASTPRVKVLVFGIGENAIDATVRTLSEESGHTHSESIVSFGWFFLDLRTPDLPERWFKLQNSRFGGEILISTTFVPFGHQQQHRQQATGISSFIKTQGRLAAVDHHRASNTNDQHQQPAAAPIHIPIAVGDGEYLRLGSRQGTDIFVISVFLQAAFNLAEVVERTLGSRKTAFESYKGGFWLSYSFFDVVVRTDVFHDLDVSEFPPIRDSFRVMSCLQDLADFFAQQNLAVYLCTYNRVLAGVEVPFSDLLSSELFSKMKQQQQQQQLKVGMQAVVEGNFAFPSTNGPFIDASIAVECIRATSKSADLDAKKVDKVLPAKPEPMHQDEPSRGAIEAPSAIAQDQSRDEEEQDASKEEKQPSVPTIRVSVDQLRLNTDAVSKLAGEEGISLELSVGSAKVSGQVRFHAFMKEHVLGDNPALWLLLRNSSFEELRRPQIRVRCFSSESQRQVGKSQYVALLRDRWECTEDIPGTSFGIEVPVYGAGGNEVLGQCSLRLELRDEVNDDGNGEDHSTLEIPRRVSTLRARDREIHVFRVFLQLKSLRDFEKPQEFAITYQNPFAGKGQVEVSEVQVVKRGEVLLRDAFCVFELLEDEQQFKQLMQAAVTIDFLFLNGNGQRELAGSAVFSLNFLYFSQEMFCCAEPTCGKTFRSQAGGEAHFEEAHYDHQNAHTPSSFGDGKVHLFKSCAIEIPVVSVRGAVPNGSSPHRIGTVGVVAYAEDMGVLSDEDMLAAEKMFVLQACSAQEEVRLYDAFTAPIASPPMLKKASAEKRTASTVEILQHDASNAQSDGDVSSSTRPPASPSTERRNRQQVTDNHGANDKDEARTREISLLKKSFEREKQLWMQEQQSEQLQWKRRLEAREKARMNELEEEWARREEERSSLLRTTQAEYERLERALRTSLLELEARERRLAIAENALQRDQQNQKDENEHFRKRLQSDHTHALSIAHKQGEAQEKRISTLEKQLSDAEKRARQVEADFAEYRLQQRKVPESRLREEISALKGSILELEKQKMHVEKERDAAQANCRDLNLQLEKLAKLVQSEKKKNEVRVAEELEKLRVKFVAREEKYVLDGDREELRAIKKQLDELKGLNLRGSNGHDHDYDPVTITPRQEREQHQHGPPKQRIRRSGYRRVNSAHHHPDHHASIRRAQRHVLPLYPVQQQQRGRDGRSSSSSVNYSNWDNSRFSSIDLNHRRRYQHRPIPSDSLPPDEGVNSINGGGSIRSSGSSQHYEHEGDDESDDEEEEGIDDEGFERYSDDQLANENQVHNASNAHHHHAHELDRLERERKLLLASGAYDEQSYLVRELTRLIEVTRTREEAMRQHDPLI